MYSSRGIGRQPYGDRRPNDRDKQMSSRSPYQDSPDQNFRSEVRDKDVKINKGYNDRREYRNSPDINNSYGGNSRDGYTPPGLPPPSNPLKNEPPPTPKSYAPMPSNAKPMQPSYSHSVDSQPNYPSNQTPRYESNRTPKYNTGSAPKYTPTPIYRPTPSVPTANSVPNVGSYGRDPYSKGEEEEEEEELTPKEMEEKLWQQKVGVLFQGVNSIDQMITLKEQYAQKTQHLDAILEKSKLREGEILRNKRRNRDDFRDPAMLELRTMQADIKRKLEEVSRFQVEIDKRIRAYNKMVKDSIEKVIEEVPSSSSLEKPHNYEAQLLQNSMITTTAEDDDEEDEEDEYEYENSTKEYYDPANHWCRDCDKVVPKINEFFEHLHTKDHWGIANNDLKPWRKPKRPPVETGYPKPVKTKTAIKGVQFLIPLRGYYCPLCKDYLADNTMAEEHMKGAKHNRIYNRFTCLNMDYEEKWNTDKGKALVRHQANERKRIKDEEQKELDKKKKIEDQKQKEEKEIKKRKREEELKRKEKEEKEREREREREEYKKSKSSSFSSSADRFRLKDVTTDLKGSKSSSLHKEKDRGRDREKEKDKKKRTRIYSSSSDSSGSSSPPRKKKQTYFGNPYKDPQLKRKSFVKLIRLDKKTAHKYHCRQLLKVIEESKSRKANPKSVDIKTESKTEITIASSPITMDIDMNYDDNENKEIKSLVEGVLENLIDEDDYKEENLIKSDTKDEQKSDKESENKSKEWSKQTVSSVKDKDSDTKTDKQKDDIPDESESEPNLEIDTDRHDDDNLGPNQELSKESDSIDNEVGKKASDSKDSSD